MQDHYYAYTLGAGELTRRPRATIRLPNLSELPPVGHLGPGDRIYEKGIPDLPVWRCLGTVVTTSDLSICIPVNLVIRGDVPQYSLTNNELA